MIGLAFAAVVLTALPVNIETAHDNAAERETATLLEGLLRRYDVSRWVFTQRVRIEEGVIPHSHPVLTIHTRHRQQELLLLSTFLHEQLHWFLESRPKAREAAVADLEKIFPKVPVGFPDGGDSRRSTYEHLLVTYLEGESMSVVVGEARSKEAMRFWEGDHYRWIYEASRTHRKEIHKVVRRHGLLP